MGRAAGALGSALGRRALATVIAAVLVAGLGTVVTRDHRSVSQVVSGGGPVTSLAASATTALTVPVSAPVADVEVPTVTVTVPTLPTLPAITVPDITLSSLLGSDSDAADRRCMDAVDPGVGLSGPISVVGMYAIDRAGSSYRRLARVGDPGGWTTDGALTGFHLPGGAGLCTMTGTGGGAQSGFGGYYPFGGVPALGTFVQPTAGGDAFVALIEHSPNYGTSYIEVMDRNTRVLREYATPDYGITFTVSPTRAEVAFLAGYNTTCALYVMQLADGATTKIATSTSGCSAPVYAPNGEHIAFADGLRIRVLSRDGTDEGVVNPNGEPWAFPYAWSPDSTQIVYSGTYYNQPMGVWVANIDGSNTHQIGTDASAGLQWLHDGSAVIGSSVANGHAELILYPLDSSPARTLVTAAPTGDAWSAFLLPPQPTSDGLIHFAWANNSSL